METFRLVTFWYIFLSLCLANFAQAQQPPSKISGPMNSEDAYGYLDLHLMSTDDHVYFTYVKDLLKFRSLSIYKYDRKFNLVSSKEISASEKQTYFISAFSVNYHIYLWTYTKDLKGNTDEYFISRFNENIEIEQVKSAGKFESTRANELTYHEIFFSRDSTMMAVLSIPKDKDTKKEKFGARVVVFDRDLNILWENKVTLPYNQLEFDYGSGLIGEDTTFYISGTQFLERKNRRPAMHYINGSTHGKLDLPVKENVTLYSKLISLSNGMIYSAGYTGSVNENTATGIWSVQIKPNTRVIEYSHVYKFTTSDFKQFDNMYRLHKERTESGLNVMYSRNHLIELPDHRILFASESDYNVYKAKEGLFYFSEALIGFILNKEGKSEEMITLPKQERLRINEVGTSIYVRPNHIYFIYSDTHQNLKRPQVQKEMRANDLSKEVPVVARYTIATKKLIKYPLSDESYVMFAKGGRTSQDKKVYFPLAESSFTKFKFRILEISLD